MRLLKAAAVSVNQVPLDWQGNLDRIMRAIEEAKKQNISVLSFPELCISGYGCEDAFLSHFVADNSLKQLKKITEICNNIVVSVGLPILINNCLYNAVALIADRQVKGFVLKRFLAGDGVHYEHRWFKGWKPNTVSEVSFLGVKVPAGDIYFNLCGIKIGVEICEDAWMAERPAVDLAGKNIDIIFNPSASHFAFGKVETRKRIIMESSRYCSAAVVYANLSGLESGRIIFDGGSMIASGGELVALKERFSFRDVEILSAVIDLDSQKHRKSRNFNYNPSTSADPLQIDIDYSLPESEGPVSSFIIDHNSWEQSKYIKFEEFSRAVALGLYDYMRKSYSKGFVLSLSGGLDSGALAVLIFYMLKEMKRQLGADEFIRRFRFFDDQSPLQTEEEIYKRVLCCVYQATENSGSVTENAAETLAVSLGFSYYKLQIQQIVDNYISLIEENEKRSLSWSEDDITLQNIQARVRGPSVWMLANIRKALLLATSNRSEAAVGYATMDGDTCGGLSPLAGIDKPFLIEWMKWVADNGPENLGPIPEVSLITAQKPTAELRPQAEEQSDERDLMPYNLLDKIEKEFIRFKRTPLEIYKLLSKEYIDLQPEELKNYIKRFFNLWRINQWKRERYAPSFHLDDESLDPKSSLRYPILSGSFCLEFAELDEYKD